MYLSIENWSTFLIEKRSTKWTRSTFSPITVNDPSVELEMLFIVDLIEEMLDALEGKEHRCELDGVVSRR